jgi:hypothetical protein
MNQGFQFSDAGFKRFYSVPVCKDGARTAEQNCRHRQAQKYLID